MSNDQQIEYWNGAAGHSWVAQAEALDHMLQGVSEAILERAALQAGQHLLDVGCGSGALTFAAQDRIGPHGRAIGVDISKPLIDNAQKRAMTNRSPAHFIVEDASAWRAPHAIDIAVSRFGIMFFDDPVGAFANILQSVRTGGRLAFACWRNPKENDMGGGLMKAVSHLFTPPDVKPDPRAPGPFAFADRDYVLDILTRAGWREVVFHEWDGALPLLGADAREIAERLARMGAIGRLMREQNVEAEHVIGSLLPFLETRKQNGKYALNGAAWIVTARK